MKRLLFLCVMTTTTASADDLQDFQEAIQFIRPKAQWNLRGDTYEGLEWTDPVQTKPTRGEVAQAIGLLRAAEKMPDVQEQLDALMEGGAALEAIRLRVCRAKKKLPPNAPCQ